MFWVSNVFAARPFSPSSKLPSPGSESSTPTAPQLISWLAEEGHTTVPAAGLEAEVMTAILMKVGSKRVNNSPFLSGG